MNKKCTKCNQLKSLDEFHKDFKVKDGHVSQCIKCIKEYGNKYRVIYKEREQIRHKEYREKSGRTLQKRIYQEGQIRSRGAVCYAVKHGHIKNLKEEFILCVDCKTSRAIHWDHRDYNKPLEVEPVCITCNLRRGKAIPLTDLSVKRHNFKWKSILK